MSDTTGAPRGKRAALRPPANPAAAAALLERYALVDGQLAAIEADRKQYLGEVNALADSKAGPLIAELQALAERLRPWWDKDGTTLAKGRKSVQLGGCMVGYRATRTKLEHTFKNDDAAAEALRTSRYAKQTTRVKYSLNRTGTAQLLEAAGKPAIALKELGFAMKPGEDLFFIERVEQPGTVTAA